LIIIGLTDVHGSIKAIERMNDIINNADVVLFVWEMTNFGRGQYIAGVVSPVMEKAG